ncbi:hypothetical protein CMI42_02575 [Candidatus Pacearchaeota archaeon]|nr:hypothetical protein [Candidatus Pacearchaeota archaeon]
MKEIKAGLEIGRKLRAGLEIHQQLDTHKLFCNCPSVLRKDDPEIIVKRKLHAVAGESGEVDVAAKHEIEQDREFVYQGYDTTCLVELDEEPPYLINDEALMIGLHVALLLNCEIIPIAQIMRKTVVDGSNTSGFQRTVLIARNGYVETESGRVGIDNVSLEEDSARIVSLDSSSHLSLSTPSKEKLGSQNNGVETKTYRLDRLGIPMIEIGTSADIKSAEQAKEVALHLGDILRSCKVKRGIGTIRQDVNVSIKGHPRIEIKGFQDVKMLILTIENEVKRQEKNVKGGKNLNSEVRNALASGDSEFLRPMPGAARMYPETDLPLLRINKKLVDEAKRTLPKLRSEIKKELEKKGLIDEEIGVLLKSSKLEEFSGLLKIFNEPRFIFRVLIGIPKELSSKEDKSLEEIYSFLSLDVLEEIVNFVKEGKIEKSDVKHVMGEVVKGRSLEGAVELERIDLSDVEGKIAEIVKKKPGLSIGGYMGLIMKEFKGKVSGKEVNEILGKLLR